MSMPAHHPPTNPKSPFTSMAAHHVAVRVPDYQRTKDWYTSKLDFRVVHEWPYGDLELAYLAPAADNNFHLEILGGADPTPKIVFDDLAESLGRRSRPAPRWLHEPASPRPVPANEDLRPSPAPPYSR